MTPENTPGRVWLSEHGTFRSCLMTDSGSESRHRESPKLGMIPKCGKVLSSKLHLTIFNLPPKIFHHKLKRMQLQI